MEWFAPARRLGRRLGGGRSAPRGAADLDARLRARLRPLPRVGRAGDPRPVRRAGAAVRGRARPTCAAWGAGGCARCTASRPSSSRSGTWSWRRGCRSRGSPPASDYLGEGYVIVRDPDTAVVRGRAAPDRQRRPRRAGRGLRRGPDERRHALPRLPGRDGVLHPGARRRRAPGSSGSATSRRTRCPRPPAQSLAHYEHVYLADEGAVLDGAARAVPARLDRPGGVPLGAVHDPGGPHPRGRSACPA